MAEAARGHGGLTPGNWGVRKRRKARNGRERREMRKRPLRIVRRPRVATPGTPARASALGRGATLAPQAPLLLSAAGRRRDRRPSLARGRADGTAMADKVNNGEPSSHALDEKRDTVRDDRVAHIVELKMRLQYPPGTADRLAEEWGVSVQYVHNLSCDANKVVRQSAADPDAVAAELLPDLLHTFRSCGESVREPEGDKHAQAKMAASYATIGALLADITGLKAPKTTKTELSGPDGGPVQVAGPLIFTPKESED